jgi:long-chain acyl-CoA synthetase
LRSLSAFHIHGAALDSRLARALTTAFPQATVGTGYGLTETCGSICVAAGADLLQQPACSGRVLPSAAVKVIDANGFSVPAGGRGELLVRGAMTMQGYLAPPEHPAFRLVDGWLKTGELARLGHDGSLWIVDRLSNVILCGGSQIVPAEIERAVLTGPGVKEAAVLGCVSTAGADALLLAVLVNAGNHLDVQLLEAQLPVYTGVPGLHLKIVLCDTFPRTASGKVNRRELRHLALERLQITAATWSRGHDGFHGS